MIIRFASQSYQHESLPVSAQRCVNFYAEMQPPDAKTRVSVHGCPGIVDFATLGSGPVRGGLVMGGVAYFVSGAFLYSLSETGTATNVGGQISGSGVVSMSTNGSELVIVNGSNGYIYDTTSGFRLISDADFFAASTVTYADGFFLFPRDGTRTVFRSELLDGTSYDSSANAAAETESSNVLAVLEHKQIVYVFKEKAGELWNNKGTANFPFGRIDGATIDRGIIGAQAVTDEDESPFILGNDRIAYRLRGHQLTRISTHALESHWENYQTVSDCIAFAYTFRGHKFINFTFPAIPATFSYDIASRLWHERVSHDRTGINLGRWRANCVVEAYGRQLVGDSLSGKVGYIDANTYTEFGNQIHGELVSPPIQNQGRRFSMPWFELDIETGVGLASGQGSDPQIMLSISDNGGRSFESPEVWASMGPVGHYDSTATQLRWDRLGRSFNRHLKLMVSDPVRRTILDARCPELN